MVFFGDVQLEGRLVQTILLGIGRFVFDHALRIQGRQRREDARNYGLVGAERLGLQ